MKCIPCARAFHDECRSTGDKEKCCCKDLKPEVLVSSGFGETETLTPKIGRPPKDDTEISISAGRKRAAELYGPDIGEELPCEWRGLGNCGGGKHPILGCLSGIRRDIHHGPIKLSPGTINNDRKNISLICAYCHHRWHAANDPDYDATANAKLPKAPRVMTLEESVKALTAEIEFNKKKEIKTND